MRADEIRSRFLDYFARNGHASLASSSLVPTDDPTLLFTNAGMVQFKRRFLGMEETPYTRATTSQKCVRAGGKHNDLEQVGFTARHHTFFEMLGNFSFGDYFKRDAIRFAWEFVVGELGIPVERLWATVHHTDDEAAALWLEIGMPPARIVRLGDKDNFWQMGDTGPCGPCSELHFDRRPDGVFGTDLSTDAFEAATDSGEILEFWNLVFMQYDRDAGGELHPLPAPSIDTGAGLERIASLMQDVPSNYGTDLFTPILERIERVVGKPYAYDAPHGAAYRVIADHARAVAFLLADGVYPSNEGRGYVLRRILRRAVRHAWLQGRREPTLVEAVDATVDRMAPAFPELGARREYLLGTTRSEEERFLATIDGGMARMDEIAPEGGHGVVAGDDVFRLYDTFGFPPDLTALIAAERGYAVDLDQFERELDAQRTRSREDRQASGLAVTGETLDEGWEAVHHGEQEFAAYRATELETDVLGFRQIGERLALQLRESPFYAESGGQVADRGRVVGQGWEMEVDEVRRVAGRVAVVGTPRGSFQPGTVRAAVEERGRRDTERNHTATHLLHAALRQVLGEHVHQQGSRVEPDRLRFDFTHSAPMTPDQVSDVEGRVNQAIWANQDVDVREMPYREALDRGATALFSEKYGDRVRVVEIHGTSMELCGGTHVRTTGQIGLFRIASESGVAAGVRRIEAVTGPQAFARVREDERILREAASLLRTREDNLIPRLRATLDERRELERQLDKARRSGGGGDALSALFAAGQQIAGLQVLAASVEVETADELRALGDQVRERLGSGVAVLAAQPGGRASLLAVATDDAIERGARADAVIREVAALAGGKGGGRPHLAQAGIANAGAIPAALAQVPEIVARLVGTAGG